MSNLNVMANRMVASNAYIVKHWRNGKVIWEQEFKNLVVDQGCNDVLDKYFKGSAYTASFYMGLKAAGSVVAGDTAASHAGWAEVTAYTGNRKAISLGAVASKSVDNTASPCTFTFTGSAAVAGIFIQTTDSGTGGILYGAADFAALRNVVANDVLSIDATFTQASA